ncbi:OmpA family protein [Fulvivirga sp. M361]|uniref:OmpA family protein n=1 Tax=Fulvivirga sp. M361 TaxID=2594266 RepID=UPI001179D96D|nr:OmpA family protein [Fulvivirga sp. M361]TRX62626.1 OmpA family protein [Fulvivirga sp. M361]
MKPNLLFLKLLVTVSCFNIGFTQGNVTITFPQSSYYTGDIIEVQYRTQTPLEESAWLGLFKASIPRGSRSGYEKYHYVRNNTSGTYAFEAPAISGKYEFRVFDSEYGKEVHVVPVTVRTINPGDLAMAIVTTDIKPAQPFEVKVESRFNMNEKAWVGIFSAKANKDDYRGYTSYEYVGHKKEAIFKMQAPAQTGDYELRFYASDPGALVKRVSFRLGALNLDGISFEANKQAYDPEEEVIVQYKGHPDLTDRAWIGIFDPKKATGTHGYMDYQYLTPKTGGSVTFKAPASKGKYDLRVFYTDQGPQLLEPLPFEVTSSIDSDYLKKNLETNGRVVLYGIYFDTDKSTIQANSYPLIEQIAMMLKADAAMKVRIEGHSDSQGEESYNQALSEERAAAVSSVLTSKYGVSTSQLRSKGYGESKPVGDNRTSTGRAKNRRVELVKF